eukprot:1044107-Pleurochrysis_carterae.AAC.1
MQSADANQAHARAHARAILHTLACGCLRAHAQHVRAPLHTPARARVRACVRACVCLSLCARVRACLRAPFSRAKLGSDAGPLRLRHCRVVRQPGDGSCLYHSLRYGLQACARTCENERADVRGIVGVGRCRPGVVGCSPSPPHTKENVRGALARMRGSCAGARRRFAKTTLGIGSQGRARGSGQGGHQSETGRAPE